MVRSIWRVLSVLAALYVAAPAQSQENSDLIIALAQALEERLDARIGVYIHDLEGGRSWAWRADERFPMASTFKFPLCAALLHGDDATASEPVTIEAADLVSYSPVTERLVGQAVEPRELCATTLRTSDNTAANMVLEVLGGPGALTQFLRSLGNETTRLDRWETELNEGEPGSVLDTTTPRAMASFAQDLLLGDVLDSDDREQLTGWLRANEVGGPLLRAGVPDDWRIADRTGAGGYGTRGIVAAMWPPGQEAVVAAIYITETSASMDERNAAIAEIGAALAEAIQ